jgi:hypothetical protein
MAGLQKVAGSKLYIGGRVQYLSTVTLADFSGQNWLEIDGWAQTGDLGTEQETLTQTLINRNVTIYSKGVISFPIMQNVFVPMLNDAGQIQFVAAQKSCKPFAFKIEWGADCGEESVVTITNADPAVVTWTSHGLEDGTPVTFETTGTLPTGLTAGTIYYIVESTTNAFSVAATVGGAAIATSGAGTGVHTATAQPVGETDLFYGFAMRGTKTGGDTSANRLLNLPIQPIAEYITV